MLTLKNIIENQEDTFKGIVILEQQSIYKIQNIGITMSWVINYEHIKHYEQIMIIGSDDNKNTDNNPKRTEKGKYFIAKITKVLNMNDIFVQTKGLGDEQTQKYLSHLQFPIPLDQFNKYWDTKRYAIYFDDATEIKDFHSDNFEQPKNPILYIKNKEKQVVEISTDDILETIKVNIKKLISQNTVFATNQLLTIQEIERDFAKINIKNKTEFENPTAVIRKTHNLNFVNNIKIEKYRNVKNYDIQNFNAITIFVSQTNHYKTSILESIYLLCRQNDILAALDLWRTRIKDVAINYYWLLEHFSKEIRIAGQINNKDAAVNFNTNVFKRRQLKEKKYLGEINISAKYDNEPANADISFYKDEAPKTEYNKLTNIFNAYYVVSLPFIDKKLLLYYFNSAKKSGFLKDIINFIVENINPEIADIQLINDLKGQNIYLIMKRYGTLKDIRNFGDSIQKIFGISIFLSMAKNGILIIDNYQNDFPNYILTKFTDFLIENALKLNVQLFITVNNLEIIEKFTNKPEIQNKIAIIKLDNGNKLNNTYTF